MSPAAGSGSTRSDFYLRRKCPKRMTVRVPGTGETLSASEGLPVTDPAEKYPLFTLGYKAQKRPAMVRWPVTDSRRSEGFQGEFLAIRKDARHHSLQGADEPAAADFQVTA